MQEKEGKRVIGIGWITGKYRRYREIQRHSAGETMTVRGPEGNTRRLYLTDWAVLSRLELERQRKHTDHTIRWMDAEAILSRCEPYDIVSFDVFDTLLCRGCGAPEHIFQLLEKENGIPDFAQARQAAEVQARREKGEVALEDIYGVLEKNGTVAQAEKAMASEWEMEKRLMLPHPMMLRIAGELARRGKRIIAVSDMYLSAGQIGELLSRAGYPPFERIFVSCEEGCGKAGGALYRRVREQLGLAGKRVLHMGDNEQADGACPAMIGWDTALLMNPVKLPWTFGQVTPYGGDMVASALRWLYRYGGAGQFGWRMVEGNDPEQAGPGTASASMTKAAPGAGHRKETGAEASSETDSLPEAETLQAVYGIGYTVAGPLTVGFCQWISRMRARQGWEKLFFSARDGWMMHRVYTRYFGEAAYLPVSRAAVQMLDADRQPIAFCDNNLPAHMGTGETAGEVLKDLIPESLQRIWQAEGMNLSAPFDREAERIREWILRDREKLGAAFAPARENALRYFREQLTGIGKAVIIDTGWKGSAGATLRDFLGENGISTVLDTALIGTSRSPSVAIREERGELFSWLFSPSHDRDRLARQYEGEKSLACTLMEMLYMTNLPQLMSYAGEGFTYGPADSENTETAEAMHRGILDFAEDYFRITREARLDSDIPGAAAYRYFAELIDEKDRLLKALGGYAFAMAPTPEKTRITFADRMRMNGWIK